MKKLFLIFITLVTTLIAHSQLPKWVIPPQYDQLSVKVDDCLLQTDSLGISALWTMDGKCLYKTENHIHPFKDGVAVITKKGSDELVGVVDTYGKFISLPALSVAYNHPYFENDQIICRDGAGFVYYKKDGLKSPKKSAVRSYPFHGGFAPFLAYDQPDKKKAPYYGFYRADGTEMMYKMLEKGVEKDFEPKAISFLSGIGANNRAVAVIKSKLYLFNPETDVFEPFLCGDEDSEKKRQLNLYGDFEKYFLNLPEDSVEIAAKYGKNQMAALKFDNQLRPVKFYFDGDEEIFADPIPQEYKYSSNIGAYGQDDKYGIVSMSKPVLPEQFEETGLFYGNRGFVKCNGKWGVIEILPEIDYTIKINKGQEVPFRHQTFETQIRLDLPAQISAKDARVDIPASSGCLIDKTSRKTTDTESGNFVTYNCTLTIPDSLPSDMTNITYSPVTISYDDISLFDTKIDIKAWHYKYINVDPVESETTISNGVATFTINVNAQKNVGEGDYPFNVTIEADSVDVAKEKISETRYKFTVANLHEGNNNLNILVTEQGCPPSIFPFEVYYTKPVPKKKTQEAVVVRKVSSQTTLPEIRIEL